ncbi:Signal peptidase I [Alteracholeplasma palmae J233]|uniref:Signal peptidase I n=1 Tax=Alteracholeplasma palmae (strain ATCC 49389 / J233) TaxID=1318466 RepID=U4KJV0_ALTPJ|nr:signal peptidase I [Alteracholeplasma palmae]CCV63844.1 Signal peptidase I [Alteracholeplasma palmae J233]
MKIAKRVGQYFSYIVILFLALMVLLNIVAPKKIVSYVGFNWYRIVSGSMEPQIMTNDLIIVTKVSKFEDLKEKDVITFYARKNGKEISVTHRIRKIENEIIYTIGDNNGGTYDNWDRDIVFSDVIGKVSIVFPTHKIAFLFHPVFLVTIVVVIAGWIYVSYIITRKKKDVE